LNLGLRASALAVDGTLHFSPQPRLLVRFFEKEKLSFSASACRMSQFLHLLSPNSIGLPKDLWVSATRRVPPQHSWQFAGGIHRKLGNGIEASVEGYYKTMRNLLNFSGSGLDSVDFQNWQDLVSIGTGWAYGLEFLLKKESGKFGGWLSYTLGWTERKFGTEINGGESFPHRLDRRHNLNLQLLYKLGKRWDFSSGFTYASGSAFTFPSQEYDFILPSGIITHPLVIDELNGFRLPAYHRLDFSVNYLFSQRKARHTLILGVYNAYNRKNPFFVTLRNRFTDDNKIFKEPVQVSLLPIFPTLRYTIEFK
ncbi:MAG: TonB-dependent receptor, partial [Bacteroidota bacterium]